MGGGSEGGSYVNIDAIVSEMPRSVDSNNAYMGYRFTISIIHFWISKIHFWISIIRFWISIIHFLIS